MTVQINLGSGDERREGHWGLDRLPATGTDIVCDLERPLPLATNSVGRVYAKSVLEHIDNLESLLAELTRVVQEEGEIYIYVPHWSNPFYYADYTHRRFFALGSFDYFAEPGHQYVRAVPVYSNVRLRTEKVRLIFRSPFRGLNWLMKGYQLLFNASPKWQLFYEFHLAGIIPCYAIEYNLRPHSSHPAP